jgi:hypothetical protein
MTLPAIVEQLDAVPEPLRPYYEATPDGKHRLKVNGAEEAYAAGLKKNRDELLADNAKAKAQLQQFAGIDPAEFQRLKSEAQQRAEQKAKEEGNFETLRAQMAERHEAEKKTMQERASKLEGELDLVLRQDRARAALTGKTDTPDLLMPHILAQTKTVEDPATGRYRTVVVDAKGHVRIANSSGAEMTLDDLVAEMSAAPMYAPAFRGSGASGSGAAGGSGSTSHAAGAGAVRSKADLRTDAEKAAFITKHGAEAFRNLPRK